MTFSDFSDDFRFFNFFYRLSENHYKIEKDERRTWRSIEDIGIKELKEFHNHNRYLSKNQGYGQVDINITILNDYISKFKIIKSNSTNKLSKFDIYAINSALDLAKTTKLSCDIAKIKNNAFIEIILNIKEGKGISFLEEFDKIFRDVEGYKHYELILDFFTDLVRHLSFSSLSLLPTSEFEKFENYKSGNLKIENYEDLKRIENLFVEKALIYFTSNERGNRNRNFVDQYKEYSKALKDKIKWVSNIRSTPIYLDSIVRAILRSEK